MEAVVGLFLIVALIAILTGGGRSSSYSERPVTRIDVGPNIATRATSTESSGGSSGALLAIFILLITAMAMAMGMR